MFLSRSAIVALSVGLGAALLIVPQVLAGEGALKVSSSIFEMQEKNEEAKKQISESWSELFAGFDSIGSDEERAELAQVNVESNLIEGMDAKTAFLEGLRRSVWLPILSQYYTDRAAEDLGEPSDGVWEARLGALILSQRICSEESPVSVDDALSESVIFGGALPIMRGYAEYAAGHCEQVNVSKK